MKKGVFFVPLYFAYGTLIRNISAGVRTDILKFMQRNMLKLKKINLEVEKR